MGSPQTVCSSRPLSGCPPPGFGMWSLMDHVLQFGPPMTASILPLRAAWMRLLYGSSASMSCFESRMLSSSTTYCDKDGHTSWIAAARHVLSSFPAYSMRIIFPGSFQVGSPGGHSILSRRRSGRCSDPGKNVHCEILDFTGVNAGAAVCLARGVTGFL